MTLFDNERFLLGIGYGCAALYLVWIGWMWMHVPEDLKRGLLGGGKR